MSRRHAMFVHAHPDDESSKAAATMARYAAEGHRVSVVTLTDGMAGDILNPAMDRPGVKERMGEIRRVELSRALDILGVTDHVSFGYADSGYVQDFDGDGRSLADDAFYNVPLEDVVARLVAVVREWRPDVVVTYPVDGGYPHPDHIRCHEVSAAAFESAADPSRYPEAGLPWAPSKLYYCHPFTRGKLETLHAACEERGLEFPYGEWLARFRFDPDNPITTRVEVSRFLEHRSRALLAHETQIDPHGRWFAIPDEVVAEVYPYEDFTLARSRTGVALPEDSLFSELAVEATEAGSPAA